MATLILVASLVAGAAHATPVTWLVGGTVNSVDSMLTGTFQVGDPVSIKLIFDPSTPVTGAIPNIAAYDFIQFDLTFGSYTVSYLPNTGTLTSITVVNNGNTGLGMADGFGASGFDTAGAPVNGLLLQSGFFSLFDFNQVVFSNTSLPSSLILSDFQTMVAGLQFCTDLHCGVNSNPNDVFATIQSLAVVGTATAPEPPTWVLVLLGLCAMASTKFCTRSQRKCSDFGG